ncbi:uncharacterized protein LOC117491507 [Xyrichtys novacula]|uniref:Uncharacterized protein LOC117491507 n=1 Tax=Xyrichtys novacula TaxID=13765 RepID=A0AAV1EPV8_XYRNO|nr:uncharacterized protein LOC117491507 [Xyrichtys novacula]
MNTTPTVRCHTSLLQRHQNKCHAELDNLCPLACAVIPGPSDASTKKTANFMLLNTCSLNNKAELIHDIITERELHFMCLTKTWQNQQDFISLILATPPGYVYIQKPHSMGRGGGLAVIHKSDIMIKDLPINSSTFECMHFVLTGAAQLQVVLVSRPPKTTSGFLSEFSELLTTVCPMSPSTIILGNFNIHVDSHSCPFATEFLSLLECLNITQHVHGPTHFKGHTLDLVCSTGITPLNLQCLDLAVLDHLAILFSVPEPLPRLRVNRTITFRHIKRVSTPALSRMLALHLASHPSSHTVDALTEHYNKALSLSLDAVAPLKTVSTTFSQPAPWLTPELRLLKATGRWLERLYKKIWTSCNQEAYKDHLGNYKEALSRAKTLYYSTLISKHQNHPKQLFSTVNRLLRPPDPPQPSDAAELCCKFQTFFQQKVDDIHLQLRQIGAPCPPASHLKDCNSTSSACPRQCSLSSFSPLSNNQVMDFVSKAKTTSSKLDPMPTALVKACLPTLCPPMTNIINTSLTPGVVPSSFKTAMVIPTLKKSSLDPDDPGNYRLTYPSSV